MNQEIMG